MWRGASAPKKQALLRFQVLSKLPESSRGVCLLSSWRVASSHLHSGRTRVFDIDGGKRREQLRALQREGDHCGQGSNQTCVTCVYTIQDGSVGHVGPTTSGGATLPSIGVECRYLPGDRMRAHMPSLPRFGMRATFDKRFSTLRWFGKGPFETYADRQSAARIGQYEGSVSSQLHPYLRPQETGNKVGVRWLALRENQAKRANKLAVLVSVPRGLPPLSASAHHVVTSDLDLANAEAAQIVSTHHLTRTRETQKHAAELVERELTEVHLDSAQMGVGGVHSWGARPDESVMLPPHYRYRVAFHLRLIDESDAKARAAAAAHIHEVAAGAMEADGGSDAFRCKFPGDETHPFAPGAPIGDSTTDGASESSGAGARSSRAARRRAGRLHVSAGKRAGRGGRGKRSRGGSPSM